MPLVDFQLAPIAFAIHLLTSTLRESVALPMLPNPFWHFPLHGGDRCPDSICQSPHPLASDSSCWSLPEYFTQPVSHKSCKSKVWPRIPPNLSSPITLKYPLAPLSEQFVKLTPAEAHMQQHQVKTIAAFQKHFTLEHFSYHVFR